MRHSWLTTRTLIEERIQLVSLLPHAGLTNMVALCACRIAAALVPAINAFAVGWFIRTVVAAANRGTDLEPIILPTVALVGLLVMGQFAELSQEIVGFNTARRIDGWVRRQVREIALAPADITHLEMASFHDDISLASDLNDQRSRRRSLGLAVVGQVVLTSRILSAVLAAAILVRFSLVFAIALLVASLLMRSLIRQQWLYLADIMDAGVGDKRRTNYWSDLASSSRAATEVRMFGLGEWLVAKYQQAALVWLGPIWRERRGVLRRQGPVFVLSFGSALAALLLPGMAAAVGRLDPGTLVTYLTAAWGVFNIGFMGPEAFDIEYGMGSFRALKRLTAHHVTTSAHVELDSSIRGVPSIQLEKVTFSYPGSQTTVLDEFDLEIKAGEVLAVVGHNGVGKTTLVKLLARLYQPTAGRILVNGVDLASLDVEQWRGQMVAVFQDFVHYPATVRDNIALSAPEHLDDLEGVRLAAEQSGAREMIAKLHSGFDTPLWRGTTGGVNLSGGQWQKLAIARALFASAHGRRLLILDEPTAHLDVQAEAEFFERVIAEVEGATVVLISHRLSTVRRADRIVLLDGGRIAECGTHDELIVRNGQYARLFEFQAAQFAKEGA